MRLTPFLPLCLAACAPKTGTPDTACESTEWYADADADGYGTGDPITSCDAPDGYASGDGIDADCDGIDGVSSALREVPAFESLRSSSTTNSPTSRRFTGSRRSETTW